MFLELSCFFNDPTDVSNFISGSSAFSKSSLKFWKFTVHVLLKPALEFLGITLLVCAAAAAELLQLCPTLCNSIDSSPPGTSVHGIFQARTLEWVAISFSNA